MRSPRGRRGSEKASLTAQAAAPTAAAARMGAPARMVAAAPAPARRMPPGDMIASAVLPVLYRSGNRSIATVRTIRHPQRAPTSEVGDHRREDLVDRLGVAGV